MNDDYSEFLARKSQCGGNAGFEPVWMPDFLFDVQQHVTAWSIRKGRALVAADCGLGKTPMELVWAENVVRKTGGRVLIPAPLAVSHQIVREAEKFGLDVERSSNGKFSRQIVVTNYERLHLFNPSDFVGMACDESGCIKHFNAKRTSLVIDFMRKLRYRLLSTATAAPNDYWELGTSSEALGYLGFKDMMTKFFKDESKKDYLGWGRKTYRFRGHSEMPFWKWVCSWALAYRKPSDLGFEDDGFILPPLTQKEHCIENSTARPGMLFSIPAITLREQREERRITMRERCETAADLASSHDGASVIWCHLNPEGDLLETLIPNAIQVAGKDSEDWKESANQWFCGHQCICSDSRFSAKLAAWRNQEKNRHTSQSIIENIVSGVLRNLLPTGSSTDLNASDTLPGIIRDIRTNIKKLRSNAPHTISGSVSVMHPIPNIARHENAKLNYIASESRSSELLARCAAMVQHWMNICGLSAWDALSVERKNQATREVIGFISTTTTEQESSVDCYALSAILGSENFETILKGLSVPLCTCGYISGDRKLIAKSKIFGWGLNWQHCHNVITFPSHSFEQHYQSVRRCWRFGQKHPVSVTIITTEGEHRVIENLQRKSDQCDAMFTSMTRFMREAQALTDGWCFDKNEKVPSWLHPICN